MSEYDNYEEENNLSENEEVFDLHDDDLDIDDYPDMKEGIDESLKESKEEIIDDDNSDVFNFDNDFSSEDIIKKNLYQVKRTTNFQKMTFYEMSKLIGELAHYITENKILCHSDLENHTEVISGDPIRIARCMIENRKKYPLPITIIRKINNTICEKLNPSTMISEEDLDFKDDGDDSEKFYYNFRSKPYKNAA